MAEKKKKNSEPKKLALFGIWQILKDYSDSEHMLTQDDIAKHLFDDFEVKLERKAISKNINLLKEAGVDIVTTRNGAYIESREFYDAELRLLIDGVLSSKHITAKHSKDLIAKLCAQSNIYFKDHLKHVYSVNDWSKTDNQQVFLNIELIDEAISSKKQIVFDYNKYGMDKKLHRSSIPQVSPYQMILHNQRYYLMALSEEYKNITFYRLDHITNVKITDKNATDIRKLPDYKNGIDYTRFSSSMPYLFPDDIKNITFKADKVIVDQIIDWFGKDIRMIDDEDGTVTVTIKAGPAAMEYWAMQYLNYVEVLEPADLRETIKNNIKQAAKKYK